MRKFFKFTVHILSLLAFVFVTEVVHTRARAEDSTKPERPRCVDFSHSTMGVDWFRVYSCDVTIETDADGTRWYVLPCIADWGDDEYTCVELRWPADFPLLGGSHDEDGQDCVHKDGDDIVIPESCPHDENAKGKTVAEAKTHRLFFLWYRVDT